MLRRLPFIKRAEEGVNYRPAPWKITKTIFYWEDTSVAPDIPSLRTGGLSLRRRKMSFHLKCSVLA